MEFCATFVVAPRNAQVMAVVHGAQEEGHDVIAFGTICGFTGCLETLSPEDGGDYFGVKRGHLCHTVVRSIKD